MQYNEVGTEQEKLTWNLGDKIEVKRSLKIGRDLSCDSPYDPLCVKILLALVS